jgi:hypothetical protein
LSPALRSRLGAIRMLRGPGELPLLVGIAVFAAAVPALMRLPLPRLAALLGRPPRRPARSSGPDAEQLDRLLTIATRLGHPFVRTGCLTRGLTLFWFLRRRGLNVELRFGLDPVLAGNSQVTDGHCWLVLGGEPFLEPRDPRPRFAEIYRMPLPA